MSEMAKPRKIYAVLALAVVGVAAFTSSAEAGKAKGASLTLRARFNATSYLLEAAEFLVSMKFCNGEDQLTHLQSSGYNAIAGCFPAFQLPNTLGPY